MLWNSNFFMTPEAMKILRLLIDLWLPDFKFGPGECAKTLARTPWYWETVTENLRLICEWDEDLTIRHLIMPIHVECCTAPVLAWIAEHMPDVPVNVIDQYHPDTFCDPRSPNTGRNTRRSRAAARARRFEAPTPTPGSAACLSKASPSRERLFEHAPWFDRGCRGRGRGLARECAALPDHRQRPLQLLQHQR